MDPKRLNGAFKRPVIDFPLRYERKVFKHAINIREVKRYSGRGCYDNGPAYQKGDSPWIMTN